MNTKASRLQVGSLIAMFALMVGSSAALAAEPPSGQHAAPTKEQRAKMATIHEQMAACLRSDKPFADCHKEAMKSCQDMMGKGSCPMMGRGGMHDHIMHDQPSKTDEQHQQ